MGAARAGRGAAARILGIDPGTRMVGYGVVEARSVRHFHYLECGVIRPEPGPMATRLGEVSALVEEVIEQHHPAVLALELAFHGRNAESALKLGQARGAIMVAATRHGLPVHEYAPAQVKRAVAGHGRASKEEIQRRVTLLCDLRAPPPVDAADALAIALCHLFLGAAP